MANGWWGIRTATVPRVSPRSHCSEDCWLQTRVSGPGQNRSIKRAGVVGDAGGESVDGRRCADQHRRGHLPAPALGVEQRLHRVGVEGVGAHAVDRVGRQHHELAALHRAAGRGDGRLAAVVGVGGESLSASRTVVRVVGIVGVVGVVGSSGSGGSFPRSAEASSIVSSPVASTGGSCPTRCPSSSTALIVPAGP